jgi:F-type H+-transporting ATPase subunit delta
MAELATLARPYAQALYGVARNGDLTAWANWLQVFACVASQARILSLATNPHIESAQICDLLLRVAPPAQTFEQQAQNFIKLLLKRHRLAVVRYIAEQFNALKNAHEGLADAHIVSAFALDEASLKPLIEALERRLNRKLKPHVTLDSSLIGGVRVKVGDKVLDMSVQEQLAKLNAVLAL